MTIYICYRERGYRSHTTEKKFLDKVIESVKQEQSNFKPIDPDSQKEEDPDAKLCVSRVHTKR